jgi:hypothetical protein
LPPGQALVPTLRSLRSLLLHTIRPKDGQGRHASGQTLRGEVSKVVQLLKPAYRCSFRQIDKYSIFHMSAVSTRVKNYQGLWAAEKKKTFKKPKTLVRNCVVTTIPRFPRAMPPPSLSSRPLPSFGSDSSEVRKSPSQRVCINLPLMNRRTCGPCCSGPLLPPVLPRSTAPASLSSCTRSSGLN